MERTGSQTPVTGFPTFGAPSAGTHMGTPVAPNFLMVPRCTFKVEKCTGGFKVHCNCEDKMACTMLQNLCNMLQGGLCSCCITWNGMTVCNFNFTVGHCKCEITEEGCCYTCTSGDPKCCEILQAFCECLKCSLEAGCTCYFLQNNTPVCCGMSETHRTQQTKQPTKSKV
jgi:hypothetical protein